MPPVSILMSSYNAAEFVAAAVESVLQQSFDDFELIVVDDGSTDQTLAIVNDYAMRDVRVKVFSEEHVGRVAALNIGLERVTGDWVAVLDADDVAAPERLERQVQYVSRHPDVVALGSACAEISPSGCVLRRIKYPQTHARLLRNTEHCGSFFPHSSVFFKTGVARKIGGYNIKYSSSMDRDILFRLAEAGQIACLPEPLVKIRKHDNSISAVDGGHPQQITGVAATVCHLLRQQGKPDVSKGTDAEWQRFLIWIESEMERAGWFDDMQRWQELRRRLVRAPGARRDIAGACDITLRNPSLVARMLCRRWFGSNMPRRLTRRK